ncbi:SGNH/GDSL hydrolase family protein [Microbacterium sp. VKM Ac-2923]|uniref:SGNH/GDSL hydrolase family protein n=1 Tax=Microbacterium sp. VKM Ac-2923 TaxID=2929476 RepID=UPI001FB38379|nr:SGNH/GDSL hydrolase family protein [Microbacterium sp. VKM Ac-2923]MCJ1706690.1 SGNH/GDSL hydrolase family protein [Microbacterium sp. VKM Ac-2923]
MISGRRASAVSLVALAAAVAAVLTGCAAEPVVAAAGTPSASVAPGATASPSPAPSTSVTSSAAASSTEVAPTSSSRERVVTLGDSLMSGFGLTASEAWPRLLAEGTHLSVINLACPGMGFVVQGDCGTPYSGLVPAVAALQPDLLIVESSSNDFWQDGDEIRFDTASTLESLHAAAPDARIVGLSTIWNDDPEVPDDTGVTSDALRDAVESVGGTYIDVGQPLAGHPEWMQDDDVHPTARGQKAIEQSVMSVLQRAGVLT